jgi:hypothetical protein
MAALIFNIRFDFSFLCCRFILFQTLRCNVDLLKLIQLGLTFTDKDGNFAKGCTCWQFNFKFSLSYVVFYLASLMVAGMTCMHRIV